MATLNETLKQRSRRAPDAVVNVILTTAPTAPPLRSAELGGTVEAIPGLAGIYKGAFTGRQLLALAQQADLTSIEPDDEAVALGT